MISIIVPIYNSAVYLKECLDSILNQTYTDLEIILVDDGSSDDSYDICRSYAEKDKRIQVYQKTNGGPSDTRNYGIDRANGEYIMFFDSDDYAEPQLCEKLLNAVTADNTEFGICGHYNVATARTTQRKLFPESRTFRDGDYRNDILADTLGFVGAKVKDPSKLDKLTPIWARLYRRDIIVDNNVRFIDLKKVPSECVLFNFEYCLHASSASYVNEALYYYRRNTGISQTKPYRPDLWTKWDYWTGYVKGILKSQDSPEDLTAAYYSRLCCAIIPLGGNAMKLPTRRERLREMKDFLSKEAFREGFTVFDYSQCPLYWKLFFYAAKKRRTRLFYFLTWSMRKLLSFRKK